MLQVVCAIIEHEGRVLVAQRSAQMDLPQLWEFPGGKVQANETEGAALVREIREELALEVEPGLRLTPVEHHYASKSIYLIPYVCRYRSGTVQPAEHQAVQWVEPEALRQFTWCPADLPIVEEYLQQRKS